MAGSTRASAATQRESSVEQTQREEPAAEGGDESVAGTDPAVTLNTDADVADATNGDDKTENTKAPAEGETTLVDTEMAENGTTPGKGAITKKNGTPSQSKKPKRKSSAGVPEHRAKKVTKKKSQKFHVDAKPGDYYLARIKGYPFWPAIIADDDMLPQAILASRPVSAKRADGTYRADFANGGKKVNERAFPVMFLGTNEFAWVPNYDMMELNVKEIDQDPNPPRKKGIDDAYKIAAQNHDLDWFKNVLREHHAALQAEEEDVDDDEEEARPASKKSKGKRKSKGVSAESEEVEDTEMKDALDFDEDEVEGGSAKKSKPKSKKRKKDIESDGEDSKPAKTPKRSNTAKTATPQTLKLTEPKTPASSSNRKAGAKATASAKASKTKSASAKKAETKDKETSEEEEDMEKSPEDDDKPLDAEELRAKKQKELYFLRHKLQKGILTRDGPPTYDEMKLMSEYMNKMESYEGLEYSIVQNTKANKVLRLIVKLEDSIPYDQEFNFRKRSHDLLHKWNHLLAKEPETPPAGAANKEGSGDDGNNADTTMDDTALSTLEKTVNENGDTQVEQAEKNGAEDEAAEPTAENGENAADAETSAETNAEVVMADKTAVHTTETVQVMEKIETDGKVEITGEVKTTEHVESAGHFEHKEHTEKVKQIETEEGVKKTVEHVDTSEEVQTTA